MKNKKTIYNSDEFRKTVQCLTEKIREADELESVDADQVRFGSGLNLFDG